jgi:hypothetical protein
MDSADIVRNLRKTADSAEISALFAALGVSQIPKMPKDDIDARVRLPKQGLVLIFKPVDPKSSKLGLVSAHFLSDAETGNSNFSGELPRKLSFTDTQAEVHQKLGKPTLSIPPLRRETWKTNAEALSVKYSKDSGQVTFVSVDAPEYF